MEMVGPPGLEPGMLSTVGFLSVSGIFAVIACSKFDAGSFPPPYFISCSLGGGQVVLAALTTHPAAGHPASSAASSAKPGTQHLACNPAGNVDGADQTDVLEGAKFN